MGRVHRRKLGSRNYKNYTEASVENAVKDVIDGTLSIRGAAKKYGVPFGTLNNRYHGKHGRPHGKPPVFTAKEEIALVEGVMKCGDWGFPLSTFDFRLFVKSYLDSAGRTVAKFKENLPGEDWVRNVMKRNKALTKRMATNIKRNRAQVGSEDVKNYFDNLKQVIEGMPPQNIFNYDESNVSDDPGKKQMLYRRGTKYPEKICNHSKSATSIMMCGSAAGDLLPPYVIYKATHLWDTWRQGGPKGYPCCDCPPCSKGTRYSRTTHGWIDMVTFDDWFKSCFLPHATRLQGRKALIGDNLSSHFSPTVLQTCRENEIDFVCLVPNSTQMLQPLDVAFFRPFKGAWRNVLTSYKTKNPKTPGIPKDVFPRLLKDGLDAMDSIVNKDTKDAGISRNLKSGFRACGIFPFSPEAVLKKIPGSAESVNEPDVDTVLTAFLKESRFGPSECAPKQKKTKLSVEPGKSIAEADTTDEEEEEEDVVPDLGLSDEQESLSEEEDDPFTSEEEEKQPSAGDRDSAEVGDFVIVKFSTNKRDRFFIGEIQKEEPEHYFIKFLRRERKSDVFVEPMIDDERDVPKDDVLMKVAMAPCGSTSRCKGKVKVENKKVLTKYPYLE